ncbi:MAG TPA: hypothetical protein VNK52_16125 [Hyphomicrobiaceae bacterium]|nr:hypothetical protein [Hyphomicrobiaceae bacterium]
MITREEALRIADAIRALINSRPRTPTREEIAEVIVSWSSRAEPVGAANG